MRKSLRFSSILLSTALIASMAQAQSADRFAYAITDVQQEGANWSFLRKIDLKTGVFSDVLLNGTDTKQVAFDAASKKQITAFSTEQNRGFNSQPAFSSGVAAMAYDRKNNRIWYTPMFIDQLRYIDLKTMKVYYVTAQEFTGMTKKSPDQGNIITRMTIAEDGNGYAMTNDGTHLVRFTTGKKTIITDLGTLADNPQSKGNSIHSSCTSFGGDMVADNQGNLLVFSARNNVFSVNIESKVATHIAVLGGLPANFTANGAAVTPENKILLTSAVDATSYLVDINSWSAQAFQPATAWRSSDLGNSNILNTVKTKPVLVDAVGKTITDAAEIGVDLVQVYPNPVTDNQFSVLFSKLTPGEYNLQVTDVTGRTVLQRILNVTGTDQVEKIRLNAASSKGFYLVKLLDKNSASVFSKKIIVQ